MASGTYTTQTDLPVEAILSTILDFPSYPDFLETVQTVQVRLQGPPVWEVYFEIEVVRRLSYSLRLELKNSYELHWFLLDGFFLSNSGYWKLTPNAKGTLVEYKVQTQIETFLPRMIKKMLSEQLLPKTVDSFTSETRARLALKKIDPTDN